MSLGRASEKAHERKTHSGFIRMIAWVAAGVLAVFCAYTVVNYSIKMKELNKEYNELVAQTRRVEESNDEISRYLEDGANLDEYIERMAREKLDYAMPDEKIFYIVPYLNE